MEAIHEILSQGFMITGFVMIMMLVIEYLNVLTRGNWDHVIAKWKTGQSLLCSFLGVTPGCLGAYAAGSLYIHRAVGVGALTAAMVATCGDESFFMLALFPKTALAIFAALFIGGIITGIAIDLLKKPSQTQSDCNEQAHKTSHPENPVCIHFRGREFFSQWRNCSPQRGWLTLFLVLFLSGIISGTITHEHHDQCPDNSHLEQIDQALHSDHNHDAVAANTETLHIDLNDPADNNVLTNPHGQTTTAEHHSSWNWIRITFIALSLIALAIVATVPDHFLDEHLWHHLVKVHGWRILLWTIGALTVTHFLVQSLEVKDLVADHRLPVLLTACLIGILPVSGPHLVFVTLYSQQALPLSVLVANCIVQDGHGLIPTLAHSRRTFIYIKGIKFVIGLAVGLLGHAMGW